MFKKKIITLLIIAILLLYSFAAMAQEGVTFNFVDVELTTVAKFISDVTGKNFIYDERVRGKVTIIAPTKLGPNDAFSLFTSVLSLKGFSLVPAGVNAFKIVPVAEAKQSGVDVTVGTAPINENVIARVVTLENLASEDAVNFLKPIVSRTGYIASFGPGNMLLIVDTGLNIDKMIDLIKAIDQPSLGEDPELVFLEHADSETVAKLINDGMQKKARRGTAVEDKAIAEPRLNAVVLFGGKEVKDTMKRLISLLDVPAKETLSSINVYFLENADAEELAEVLENLIKGGSSKPQAVRGRPAGTPAQAQAQAGSPFQAVSGISITPDKATNSLVIVASPSDYQSILQVVKQLDRRRKQVFVEALIVEASVDQLRELGARWRATYQKDGEPVVIGGLGQIDSGALQSIISGLSGLTVGGMGDYMTVPLVTADGQNQDLTVPGFAALFSLSEFRGAVNVLSSPQILTSDNTEAEIVVGENVPFISKREQPSTGQDTVLNSIERKDVGITLRLTPQITEGDYVKIDVYQEISAVKETTEAIFTEVGPTTTKRSTSTSIAVRDGQTVVIGGLMQETDEETETRVPFLHRIPLLGWLFKYKSHSKVKTNLLVFITPHIVRDAEALSRVSDNTERKFARSEKRFVHGELMVKFYEGTSFNQAIEVFNQMHAGILALPVDTEYYRVKLLEGMKVEDAIEEFMALPEVEDAEPNYTMGITSSPAEMSMYNK